ncbi:hypothetical protein ABLE94_24440 [Gordonia sp. VNK1]|uniref:hypothetical protein n=1 Tax=Gordonia oleivorans TaxID=3156618 RepID=UPI0032B396B3
MSENEFGLTEGAILSTVVLGAPVGGVLQVWGDEPSLWSVCDLDQLAAMVGVGRIARTRIEQGRYREAGFIDDDGTALLLQARVPLETSDEGHRGAATYFALTPATEVFGNPWAELADLISRGAIGAIQRGEILVVEQGGWESQPRYCLLAAMGANERIEMVIETAPAPGTSRMWPPAVSGSGQTIRAPFSDDTVGVSGRLAVEAISEWGCAPWDLTFTYVVPSESRRPS